MWRVSEREKKRERGWQRERDKQRQGDRDKENDIWIDWKKHLEGKKIKKEVFEGKK